MCAFLDRIEMRSMRYCIIGTKQPLLTLWEAVLYRRLNDSLRQIFSLAQPSQALNSIR